MAKIPNDRRAFFSRRSFNSFQAVLLAATACIAGCQDAGAPNISQTAGSDKMALRVEAESMAGTCNEPFGDWAALLFCNGEISANVSIAVDGRYEFSVRAFGLQAGPDVARMALTVDGVTVGLPEVPAVESAPGIYTVEVELSSGTHVVGVAFLNDYWNPDAAPGQQDRNLGVDWIEIQGPLAGTGNTVAFYQLEDFNSTGCFASHEQWALNFQCSGALSLPPIEVDEAGDYEIAIRAFEQGAGPDPANMKVSVDGTELTVFEVDAEVFAPATYSIRVFLAAGVHNIDIEFTNDYYDPFNPDPFLAGDRNLVVDWFRLDRLPTNEGNDFSGALVSQIELETAEDNECRTGYVGGKKFTCGSQVVSTVSIPRTGLYVVSARAHGDRAVELLAEYPRMVLGADGSELGYFDVKPATTATAGVYSVSVRLQQGSRRIAVGLIDNDGGNLYPLYVDWLKVEGPYWGIDQFEAESIQSSSCSVKHSFWARELFCNSELDQSIYVAEDGDYELSVRAGGHQAGPDPVALEFRFDGQRAAAVTVETDANQALTYSARSRARAGNRTFSLAFTNDFWNPNDPDPNNRDRNARIDYFGIEGPLRLPDSFVGTEMVTSGKPLGITWPRVLARTGDEVVSSGVFASGRYQIAARVFGHQVGDDLVGLQFVLDGTILEDAEVSATANAPAIVTSRGFSLTEGMHSFAVVFTNDAYTCGEITDDVGNTPFPQGADPNPKGCDRNLVVQHLQVHPYRAVSPSNDLTGGLAPAIVAEIKALIDAPGTSSKTAKALEDKILKGFEDVIEDTMGGKPKDAAKELWLTIKELEKLTNLDYEPLAEAMTFFGLRMFDDFIRRSAAIMGANNEYIEEAQSEYNLAKAEFDAGLWQESGKIIDKGMKDLDKEVEFEGAFCPAEKNSSYEIHLCRMQWVYVGIEAAYENTDDDKLEDSLKEFRKSQEYMAVLQVKDTLSKLHDATKKLDEAQGDYSDLMRLNAEAAKALARKYIDDAIVNDIKTSNLPNAEGHFADAVTYMENGDFEKAVEYFSKATGEVDP